MVGATIPAMPGIARSDSELHTVKAEFKFQVQRDDDAQNMIGWRYCMHGTMPSRCHRRAAVANR